MSNQSKPITGVTRRRFLGRTMAAAAAPLIVPSRILGMRGHMGANDQIILGLIGLGGMGRGHFRQLRPHIAAVCDVDERHLARGAHALDDPGKGYKDYRRILDRDDIDAVVIASPDHWHGLQTIHACEAGKDVYVEKPASNYVKEGRAMVDAARRYHRVVQVGSQGRSMPVPHAACTYIRNGQIGTVHRVECWHYENPVGGDPANDGPAPPHLDWDMWLGPAAERPYNPDRCHFNFRWFLDLGAGQIRDRGAHVLSLMYWFLDLDHTGPVKVTATGEPPTEGLFNCPPTMEVTWEFKDPDLTVVWAQPGNRATDYDFGAVYYGSKKNLIVPGGDGGGVIRDPEVMAYERPADGIEVFNSPGHHSNFFDCIRSREKPIMDIEAGHRVCTMCNLGNLAYRLGRSLEWDPVQEVFVDDDEANRMLDLPGRGEWRL